MPIHVRGTRSREELAAELKELRAAYVRVQDDDSKAEFELHSATEQLRQLCAERAKRIEAERASWLPWSPGLHRGPLELRSTRYSAPDRLKDLMRKPFTSDPAGRARKSHERHVVPLDLRRRADRAAMDAWQNEGGSSSSTCEAKRSDAAAAAVDNSVAKRQENQ